MMLRTAVRKGLASPAVPDAWRSRSRSARALCAEGGAIVLWASCSWLRMSHAQQDVSRVGRGGGSQRQERRPEILKHGAGAPHTHTRIHLNCNESRIVGLLIRWLYAPFQG